jgi:hypothetical protein
MAEDDSDKSFISCSADDDQMAHEDGEEYGETSLKSDIELSIPPTHREETTSHVQSSACQDCSSNSNGQDLEVQKSEPDCLTGEDISTSDPVTNPTTTASTELPEDISTSDAVMNPTMTVSTESDGVSQVGDRTRTDSHTPVQISDVSSPTAAMSNGFVLPSAEARMAVLSRLRAYEAKRRPYYQGKLASSLLYWRSLCELMAQSLEEMERIESLILGNIEMQKTIAEHCQGVVEDRIDIDGKLLDSKKARKLQDEKRTRYNNLANFWKANSDQTTLSKLLGFTPPQTSAANNDEHKKLSQHSSILRSVLDFHTSSADRFAENSAILREEAWLPLMTLRSKLEEQIALMEKMGGVIMTHLESAENTIQLSWCKLKVHLHLLF